MLRVEYYTPKPPVYEVAHFPNHPDRESIAEFVEWAGFARAKKRYRERMWDLESSSYNGNVSHVAPGTKFFRRTGEPDIWQPAQCLRPDEADRLQEVDYSEVVYITESED